MLSWFISGPVSWATSAMLVNCPEGYAQMGIYNATNSWFQSVTFLPGLLAQVLLPILSGYVGANEKQKGKQALKISTIVNLLIVIPIVVIGSILSPWIMKLYGPKFIDGWPTLVLTFLAAGVLMIQSPITQQFIAHGRMWAYFGTHVLWGATFLVATHLMLPFGAVGLASGRLIAYVVNGLGFVVLAILYARSEKQTGNIT
jgi:O-antigen/teichoic acid export membrane protein